MARGEHVHEPLGRADLHDLALDARSDARAKTRPAHGDPHVGRGPGGLSGHVGPRLPQGGPQGRHQHCGSTC